ncbi:calcium-dependent phosphotriesterase [Ceratobasidium sp. AG-I]|nr:calcium-dependent phosphotriesterase [Ceratobasidium sp. AG-I]
MPSIGALVLASTAAILAILYQLYASPVLKIAGKYRIIEPLNTEHCESVEELQACEKLVIHSSGLVYLACAASPWIRTQWMPAMDNFNATALRDNSSTDYVATYDPRSRVVTKLVTAGLADPRGLNVHGMDVVVDERDQTLLWIYLVNHRPPLDPSVDAERLGADSVVEIFKTHVGANLMEWVATVDDPKIMVTPNDIVGGSNGQEFWFTNDHDRKRGLMRKLQLIFRFKSTFVGYCHVTTGCKVAVDELYSANGILRTDNGDIWVVSSFGGYISVHEQQADKTLVLTEVIQVGQLVDNIGLSSDGSIIAATVLKAFEFQFQQNGAKNISATSPAGAYRISINTGHTSYFGDKYKVEKIYEDNGALGSISTTAAMYNDDLYLHGLMAHRMLICKIPTNPSEEKYDNSHGVLTMSCS